jgi:hypothetical protein
LAPVAPKPVLFYLPIAELEGFGFETDTLGLYCPGPGIFPYPPSINEVPCLDCIVHPDDYGLTYIVYYPGPGTSPFLLFASPFLFEDPNPYEYDLDLSFKLY